MSILVLRAASVSLVTLTCFALSSGCAGASETFPRPGRDSSVTIDNLDRLHGQATDQLSTWLGERTASRTVASVVGLGKDLRIVSMCRGDFAARDSGGVALTLVDRGMSRLLYAVADERVLAAPVIVVAYEFQLSHQETFRREPWVSCQPATEIDRIRRGRQSIEPGGLSVLSGLRPIHRRDAVCVAPPESDVEFWCFQYSSVHSRFKQIGGWKFN